MDRLSTAGQQTVRDILYDNTISQWKCVCTSHPIPLYSIKECAILIADLYALKTHWTSYARASSQL